MSDSATAGGDMPRSAGCYLTFFWSAKQVSKQPVEPTLNSENTDNFTALYTSNLRFTFGTDSMHAFLVLLRFLFSFKLSSANLYCSSCGSKTLRGLSIMLRTLRPVRVQLRRTHPGAIRLPITLSGCVSSTLRNSI